MRLAIGHKFDMYSEWAKKRNLSMVIGEGYVGYYFTYPSPMAQ
jgi:hypothetical protein